MRSLSYVYAILDIDKYNKLFNYRYTQDIRYNHDKSKVLLKTYKEEPKLVGVPLYSKEHIKKILSTNEWRNNLNIN